MRDRDDALLAALLLLANAIRHAKIACTQAPWGADL